MRHATEPILIELIRGGLSSETAERVGRHLAECAECSARLEAMRRLDAALDTWSVDVGQRVLVSAVLARSAERRSGLWRRLAPVGRAAAAAVLVGALAGWAAGRSRGVADEHFAATISEADAMVRVDAEYALAAAPIGLDEVLVAMAFEREELQP